MSSPRLPILAIAALLMLPPIFGGCQKKEAAAPAQLTQPVGGPTITATPNPVPAGPGPGVTTIAWDTGDDGTIVDVYLSIDGGAEKIFGTHSKDSKQIDWIGAGPEYEFRMYPTGEHAPLLGSVKVTRNRK